MSELRGREAADEARRELHAALETGVLENLARQIAQYPGFVDVHDDEGCSLLIRAVERGDEAAARLLLEAGASANAHSPNGSAIELAASRADPNLVELLLDHGARELRVAFRIASERHARPIMEMLAHREPTLQLQMEFESDIPDQKLVNTELMSRRVLEPVLSLGAHLVHMSWDGVSNTYLETARDRPDRAFTIEVQQRLRLLVGESEIGQLDGMWYSAVMSGPTSTRDLGEDRWRVRYAYYASSGAYEHYSAIDVTLDFARSKLETVDVTNEDERSDRDAEAP